MLDLMDGRFVQSTSLDFEFQIPSIFEYEAHLMVENPSEYVDRMGDCVDWAILHIETLREPETEIDHFKENGFKISLAINPETPLEEILPYLGKSDGILVLTVDPGQYGGVYKPESLKKIERLRNLGVKLPIEVDGGVNPETIVEIKNAGANVFACGSFLMKSGNVALGIQALREALSS